LEKGKDVKTYTLSVEESASINEKDSETRKQKVLISIKVPQHILDNKGQELETTCSITKTSLREFVKTRFEKSKTEFFNKFDATERLEIIEEFLEQEIDFDYYMGCNVIHEHFPLHRRNEV